MTLTDVVRIQSRYLRAARIDSDLQDPAAIEGFRTTAAFGRVLKTVADHLLHTGHGAFTWTGPYGSGKSSLMLVLAAAIGPRGKGRDRAEQILGSENATAIRDAFRPGVTGWRVIPIVGARLPAHHLVWDALISARLVRERRDEIPSARDVLDALDRLVLRKENAGIIVVIDELGKVLEDAAASFGDIHFLQELAERSARSEKRLVVIGILHQSFSEYATRLGRQAQEEWSKVQGRFCDVPLALSGSEQIELIANAVQSAKKEKVHEQLSRAIGKLLSQNRRDVPSSIGDQLAACWPIHPVVACLLGPISRRRFGQNQRSLFGFLNSFEPHGFQDFLVNAQKRDLYKPADLFDYLQSNLEHAILASPDGHRWSSALDALERVARNAAKPVHIAIIKTIALLDLFRERSGLFASREVLGLVFPDLSREELASGLESLRAWSTIAFREHIAAYSIYAGSDFDLQAALDHARTKCGPFQSEQLRKLSNLRPIVAKKHYHETGALRWFNVDIVMLSELRDRVEATGTSEAAGRFILVVPEDGTTVDELSSAIRAASHSSVLPIVLGACVRGTRLVQLARELVELEYVRTQSPELRDDAVGRREIDARTAATAAQLESEVQSAFTEAKWFYHGVEKSADSLAELTRIASDIAKARYSQSPRLLNELLNRNSPSSNAIAAQKALLKAMVLSPTKSCLGIKGFPAERGLYEALIATPKLHAGRDECHFRAPPESDPTNLRPLWERTDELLREAKSQTIAAKSIYDIWAAPPFGVRSGLHPVLLIAYLQSRPDKYTYYLDGRLELELSDLLVDRLTSDSSALCLRTFDANAKAREFFAALRDYLASKSSTVLAITDTTGLALALVQTVRSQPAYTQRTARLSSAAAAVRNALRHASDPQVLLHESLPATLMQIASASSSEIRDQIVVLQDSLEEIATFYGRALAQLDEALRAELGVSATSDWAGQLHRRASRIRGVTGDLRVEAFATRLASFSGSLDQLESIASLAINKPPRDWVDHDFDRALLEIAHLAQQFIRAEALVRVRGRPGGQHALAFVAGFDRSASITYSEFQIADHQLPAARDLAERFKRLINSEDVSTEVILAALAQFGQDVVNARKPVRRAANE